MEKALQQTGDSRMLLTWSAPTTPKSERGTQWYLYGGSLVLVSSIYGILTGAWSFSLVMLLIGGLYVLTRRLPESVKSIAITKDGVLLGNAFTAWKDLSDFWMLQGPTYIELHIAKQGRLKGEIMIQTGPINPDDLRTLLAQFLPERSDQTERLLDTIIRICKL